jgi:alkyl hydroperoxide reductase subunit F
MSVFDCVIIGAGPAGITAAVYAARKRMSFMLISQDVGGQTALSGDVENYTGYQFITGPELVAKFEEHLKQFHVPFRQDEAVLRVEQRASGGFNVVTAKEAFETRAVIVASGRRPRLLDAEGESTFRNKGVSYCATCDGPLFSDKDVAVIGGGNSALDAALQMMQIARRVYVIHIEPSLGGDPIMREKLMASPRVEVIGAARTRQILGDVFVTGLRYEQAGATKTLAVQGVFIEIGSTPNADLIDFVAKNEAGEIKIDHANRTDVAGIFAAGDVTDVPEKQIIVAAGEGAKTVLSVFRYLSQLR